MPTVRRVTKKTALRLPPPPMSEPGTLGLVDSVEEEMTEVMIPTMEEARALSEAADAILSRAREMVEQSMAEDEAESGPFQTERGRRLVEAGAVNIATRMAEMFMCHLHREAAHVGDIPGIIISPTRVAFPDGQGGMETIVTREAAA